MTFAQNNNDGNADNNKDDIEEKTVSSGEPSQHNYSTRAYNHQAEGEAMPVYLTEIPANVILRYLGGDLQYLPDATAEKKFSLEQRQQFTLFGVRASDLVVSQATKMAQLVLHGEEKEIEEALALVKKYPHALRCRVTVKDRLGRMVCGTPLQIAGMAGDVDLLPGLEEEKDRGAVERLISAGDLLPEEVAEQLKVITSPEADVANEARNQHILSAIITFGKSLMEIKADAGMSFEAFQERCQKSIVQLEKALQPDTKNPITLGYVFDPKILAITTKWFKDNVEGFDGWSSLQSNVFWVNGFGKLQSKLSSRDAQVVFASIGVYVNNKIIPARELTNSGGTSYFLDPSSRLGHDFYLGFFGGGCPVSRAFFVPGRSGLWLETLCCAKTTALQSLCSLQELAPTRACRQLIRANIQHM